MRLTNPDCDVRRCGGESGRRGEEYSIHVLRCALTSEVTVWLLRAAARPRLAAAQRATRYLGGNRVLLYGLHMVRLRVRVGVRVMDLQG